LCIDLRNEMMKNENRNRKYWTYLDKLVSPFERLYKFVNLWAGLVSRRPRDLLAALILGYYKRIKERKYWSIVCYWIRSRKCILTCRFSELPASSTSVDFRLLVDEVRGVTPLYFPVFPILEVRPEVVEESQSMSDRRSNLGTENH
jgi:hypothetical protein